LWLSYFESYDGGIPSLDHHYSGFITTTNSSASEPDIATIALAFYGLWLSLIIPTRTSPVPYKSLCHAPAAFTPAAIRSALQVAFGFCPSGQQTLGFDCIYVFSTLRRRFIFIQLHDIHLMGNPHLFSLRSAPWLLFTAPSDGLQPSPD
jgi:hypothetical protein